MKEWTKSRADALLPQGNRKVRLLTTPEGVPLKIELADFAERASAFAIDFTITVLAAIAILIPAILFHSTFVGDSVEAAGLLVLTLGRNLYFLGFELLWGGATPGKRYLGLRVVSRNGGPLTSSAIIARNLSREVETFFPLTMILLLGGGSATGVDALLLGAWLTLTTALPLANRDVLRAGDLIGGTAVIAVPKVQLLDDLADATRSFHFSADQLGRYGILELHVLESLLRGPDTYHRDNLLEEIATKIQRRISWTVPIPPRDVQRFLRDFYSAQRAFLEARKNFGDERADKNYLTQK